MNAGSPKHFVSGHNFDGVLRSIPLPDLERRREIGDDGTVWTNLWATREPTTEGNTAGVIKLEKIIINRIDTTTPPLW